MPAIDVLTSSLAVALAAYVLAMIMPAFLVQPLRVKPVGSIHAMLAEHVRSDEQRGNLYTLRDHSMSFLVGPLVPVAVVSVIVDDVLGREPDQPEDDELARDPRCVRCVLRFFVSLAAANPLAAIVSLSLMAGSFVISLATKRKPARALVGQAVEEPTLRALGRFQPAI